MKHLIFLLLLTGCGINGNQRLTAQGRTDSNIHINMPFIEEIRELCEQAIDTDKKLIAECTLANMHLFNMDISGNIELICSLDTISMGLSESLCGDL